LIWNKDINFNSISLYFKLLYPHNNNIPDTCRGEFFESLRESGLFKFSFVSDNGFPPSKSSDHAAGFDLKSVYNYIVPMKGSCLIKTDIKVKLPIGTYGRIAPRSGLALRNKIDVGGGVIDRDYTGNVCVILFNFSDEKDFVVTRGDRIAQLICEKIEYPELQHVGDLEETERGNNGFGSSGV